MDSKKLEDILKFLIGVVLVLLINNLARNAFFRVDLTEENRFSISDPTKDLLKNLTEPVYIDVYLAGDLPAGMERFQRAIRETIDEFRVYAGNNIQYNFIDPSQAVGSQAQNEFMRKLANQGIQPTNLFATEDGKRIEKLVFPGAILNYQGREAGVMLLKGNKGASPQERLNQSIEGIEYELAMAIRKMSNLDRKAIALIQGHGELDSLEIIGLKTALSEFYDLFEVNLPVQNTIEGFDAILVAKPTSRFSEREKYLLDQYIMNGGKALFLIDALEINMDSVGGQGTLAYPMELNLDDLLFRYGLRINPTLVQDINSGFYPMVVGNLGDQPQIRLMEWPYFLVVNAYSDHPVVKNLDAVYLRFANTIDTVKAEGINKIPLLFSSPYSKTRIAPIDVSLNEVRAFMSAENPPQGGPYPLGFLLEGQFTSLYSNRVLPKYADEGNFRASGEPTKIIVIADGDLVKNTFDQDGRPLDLGRDPFLPDMTFANKDLVVNGFAYLLQEDGLITARAKEIVIRPLDKVKIENQRFLWQVINLILPLVLLILFGIVKFILRKRKYASSRNLST